MGGSQEPARVESAESKADHEHPPVFGQAIDYTKTKQTIPTIMIKPRNKPKQKHADVGFKSWQSFNKL
jgi:hypothetical protein